MPPPMQSAAVSASVSHTQCAAVRNVSQPIIVPLQVPVEPSLVSCNSPTAGKSCESTPLEMRGDGEAALAALVEPTATTAARRQTAASEPPTRRSRQGIKVPRFNRRGYNAQPQPGPTGLEPMPFSSAREPLQKSVQVASLRGRGRYRNRYRSHFTRSLPSFVAADSDPNLITRLLGQRFSKVARNRS